MYASLGSLGTLTAAQLADQNLSAQAETVCNNLSKSGLLLVQSGPNAGKRAVWGTPEYSACVSTQKSKLQYSAANVLAPGGTPNWILFAGVGAVVLVGAALLITRKKG